MAVIAAAIVSRNVMDAPSRQRNVVARCDLILLLDIGHR
jgi:hypothetical protein